MDFNILPLEWKDWKITDEIGEGSYGTVYKAEKENGAIKAVSAIKIVEIPADKSQLKELMREFHSEKNIREYLKDLVDNCANEIRTMYRLQGDSNIVSIQDHIIQEEADGLSWKIFIRMEFLQSFTDYAVTKLFTEKDIIELGISICNALSKCEKYKIIHRDIKPDNIFVTEAGEYKLGDFGIARYFDHTYASYSSKGTFHYMAPEIYKGEKYSCNVDLYSLGLILYKLANHNREPFIDQSKQIVYYKDREQAFEKRMNGTQLPSPSEVSSGLSNVILKACAYNPDDRYVNASDMKVDLEQLLTSRNDSHDQKARKRIGIYIAAAALCMFFLITAFWYTLKPKKEANTEKMNRKETDLEETNTEKNRRETNLEETNLEEANTENNIEKTNIEKENDKESVTGMETKSSGTSETDDEMEVWVTDYYIDNNGQYTDERMIRNKKLFQGIATTILGDTFPAYLGVVVDEEGILLTVTEDGESLIIFEEFSGTIPIYVRQSTCLEDEFDGTVTAENDRIRVDSSGSAFIIQDMRMLSGETIVNISNPRSGIVLYQFVIPHDSNFRKLYDSEKENWSNLQNDH